MDSTDCLIWLLSFRSVSIKIAISELHTDSLPSHPMQFRSLPGRKMFALTRHRLLPCRASVMWFYRSISLQLLYASCIHVCEGPIIYGGFTVFGQIAPSARDRASQLIQAEVHHSHTSWHHKCLQCHVPWLMHWCSHPSYGAWERHFTKHFFFPSWLVG